MLLESTDDERTRQTLEMLRENVQYMRDLVEKTIELARMEDDAFEIIAERVDVGALFGRLETAFRDVVRAEGLSLHLHVQGRIEVLGDPLHLNEVLHNLLANAIRHTPPGGRIVLRCERLDEGVMISVIDTGTGLPPEQCPRVFEEFYKVDPSRHDRSTSGLGLAISRRIVEAHGGQIWIESDGPGTGATVQFVLPAAQVAQL
jgi:signal transduction histidine kinase